ncbi:MAG: 1-deoxy-D-xylulose-5-phosphate synthase [Eubacteriales bacterium]|nr:1-deoxy-D-xylulose-5-phosphate synthase [Eubacteriales bacterium]
MSNILDGINSPVDIKKLNFDELKILSAEIRAFLLEKVSVTGGHLASNLGVVELTLAIHRVFSTPNDKIVWDVGHQTYVHKILTGRKSQFDCLRKFGGVSGFPKTSESCHDFFNTGHSSTSISAALGLARARDIKGEKYSVISVIGDGALTGGMSFEALNDAGRAMTDLIVILNDNQMSISRNVGGLSRHLGKIRTAPSYFEAKKKLNRILLRIPVIGRSLFRSLEKLKRIIKYSLSPGIIFEELGFKYLGLVDGHNQAALEDVLRQAKRAHGPVLVHVHTLKGKGYSFAEKNPAAFHGITPFELKTGETTDKHASAFSRVFGEEMVRLAEEDSRIIAVTAAMPQGTGLGEFSAEFPNRFFDVGIAEQHAVTFAAGLARNGMKPVVAIYSSFLQRAYDQILHDVAIQNLHVVFAIDRAGVVGEDGETHQGMYDISYLRHMPNITLMSPANSAELKKMIRFSVEQINGPAAVRYSKGKVVKQSYISGEIAFGKGECLKIGKDVTIAAVGDMVGNALKIAEILEKSGLSAEVINARFIKPLDAKLILDSVNKTGLIVTIEDNSVRGGFGSAVLEMLSENNLICRSLILGFPDEPIPQGTRGEIFSKYGMNPIALADKIKRFINSINNTKLK